MSRRRPDHRAAFRVWFQVAHRFTGRVWSFSAASSLGVPIGTPLGERSRRAELRGETPCEANRSSRREHSAVKKA